MSMVSMVDVELRTVDYGRIRAAAIPAITSLQSGRDSVLTSIRYAWSDSSGGEQLDRGDPGKDKNSGRNDP